MVTRDVNFIASGGAAPGLTARELWLDGQPVWTHAYLRLLQPQPALPDNDDWKVWIDWYVRRLEGVSDPEEIELVFATIPDEVREAGPAAANRWIKERLEELQKKTRLHLHRNSLRHQKSRGKAPARTSKSTRRPVPSFPPSRNRSTPRATISRGSTRIIDGSCNTRANCSPTSGRTNSQNSSPPPKAISTTSIAI
jgi:hypothetical protein